MFPLVGNGSGNKLTLQCLLVNRLKKAVAQHPMYGHNCTDDRIGLLIPLSESASICDICGFMLQLGARAEGRGQKTEVRPCLVKNSKRKMLNTQCFSMLNAQCG